LEISISASARRYISNHGGDLYVSFDDAGSSGWLVQRVTLSRPPDHDFVLHQSGLVRVWLDAEFADPPSLTICRRPWPVGPIEVTGTGVGTINLSAG
jgi:hypothetical protein